MENRNKQMLEQKEDQKEVSKKTSVSRRQFLKKSAYVTPSLIILGSLPKPIMANNGSGDGRGTDCAQSYGPGCN